MRLTTAQAYAAAVIVGVALWQATSVLTGRREAWDSPGYWIAAYPIGLVTAGVLAYLNPDRPWRWALVMLLVQPVVMVFSGGGDFGLLPLGLVMFGFLAVPPIVMATIVGARQRRQSVD